MAELTEVVADAAEEVADQATSVAEVSRALSPREVRFLLGGIGIGLVAGGVTGALVARRRLETKYTKIAEDEISEMREHFRARLLAKEGKPDLSHLGDQVADLGYSEPNISKELNDEATKEEAIAEVVAEEEVAETEVVSGAKVQNIFKEEDTSKDADEGWNYDIEIANRRANMPYVIHQDEQHEKNYDEAAMIYYAGDDVLCNEGDKIIEDQDLVIGLPNLERFGHGSDDKHRVYIRNDDLGMEIELIKNNGYYAEIVHGFVQHSDRTRTMRRRKHPYDDE